MGEFQAGNDNPNKIALQQKKLWVYLKEKIFFQILAEVS